MAPRPRDMQRVDPLTLRGGHVVLESFKSKERFAFTKAKPLPREADFSLKEAGFSRGGR